MHYLAAGILTEENGDDSSDMGRKTFDERSDPMQADPDLFLKYTKKERSHQGIHMNGRTPLMGFLDDDPKGTSKRR